MAKYVKLITIIIVSSSKQFAQQQERSQDINLKTKKRFDLGFLNWQNRSSSSTLIQQTRTFMEEITSLRIRLICNTSTLSLQICHGQICNLHIFYAIFYLQCGCSAKHLFGIIKLINGLQDIFHNHSVNSAEMAFPRMNSCEMHWNASQISNWKKKKRVTHIQSYEFQLPKTIIFALDILVIFAKRYEYESCASIVNLSQHGAKMKLCFTFNKGSWSYHNKLQKLESCAFFLLCFLQHSLIFINRVLTSFPF